MISQRQSQIFSLVQQTFQVSETWKVSPRVWHVFLICMALPLLACNVLSSAGIGGEPPVRPTLVLSTPIPTPNPVGSGGAGVATATLPAGVEPTPTGATLTAVTDVNVRIGPGVQYERDGFLLAGETAPIVGVHLNTGWWKIVCPTRSDGSECWVTGRTQFVSPANTANVPSVSFLPPAPTAIPTEEPNADTSSDETSDSGADVVPAVAVSSPAVIYLENGNVMALPMTLSSGALHGNTPVQLTLHNDVTAIFVAPGSGRVAYFRGHDSNQALHVMNADGTGDTALTQASALGSQPRYIKDLIWLADEQTLAFNTTDGRFESRDLWTVSLTGEVTEHFSANEAGLSFAFSASNTLLMADEAAVWRVNLDGSGRETLVEFSEVNTRSEYLYAPQIEWLANGEAVAVVSSRNPFARNAAGDLWVFPAGAQPQQTNELDGNHLFNTVEWSPSGNQLAYVRHAFLARNTELLVGDGSGNDPISYATDANLQLFGWSNDNSHFLYRGSGYYAVGLVSGSPITTLLSGEDVAVAGEWVTADTYLVMTGGNGNWQLVANNLSGATGTLLTLDSQAPPQFMVWSPLN